LLLNVNAIIYCKCKEQLKFRNNRHYSIVVVNILTCLHRKHLNLQLKCRNNKSYHQYRTAHRYTATSLLLKPLKHRLIGVASFKLPISLYFQFVLFKRTDNFGSGFTNLLDRKIYETKCPTNFGFGSTPPPPFSISLITLTFPLTLKTLPFIRDCNHVITSPVCC
jgi:hypothetical protein